MRQRLVGGIGRRTVEFIGHVLPKVLPNVSVFSWVLTGLAEPERVGPPRRTPGLQPAHRRTSDRRRGSRLVAGIAIALLALLVYDALHFLFAYAPP